MKFFDIKKMPVTLWRNGAGETREICSIPAGDRDFAWRASIATFSRNGEFTPLSAVDRVITLLEGGEVLLNGAEAFRQLLKPLKPCRLPGELSVRAELREERMAMSFNILTRRERCQATVRIADRSFTTLGPRAGIVYVLSGAWQSQDKLLTAEQGAWWTEGQHTLRLLQPQGQLLYSEITWLPGRPRSER